MQISIASSTKVGRRYIYEAIQKKGLHNFGLIQVRKGDPSVFPLLALCPGRVQEVEPDLLFVGSDELLAFWQSGDIALVPIFQQANELAIPVHIEHLTKDFVYEPDPEVDTREALLTPKSWAEEQEEAFERACLSMGMPPLKKS